MILRTIKPTEVKLVYEWLTDPWNRQWLEFSGGELVNHLQLRLLLERDTHYLRLFTPSLDTGPIGLVALSNINRAFGTAMPWCVLGDRAYARLGYTTQALARLLGIAFGELGLRSVHAWTVETNIRAIKVMEHNGFRFLGRQRQCHVIDGRVLDRLWFDLLSSEFEESRLSHCENRSDVSAETRC